LVFWLTLAFVAIVLIVFESRAGSSGGSYSALVSPPSGGSVPGRLLAVTSQLSPLLISLCCVLSLAVGATRYQLSVTRSSIRQVEGFNDRKYELLVTGTLINPPDTRDAYTNLRLRVLSVDVGKRHYEVGGLLLARVPVNQVYRYGQILRLRGHLQTPPDNEDFSYRDYLARQNVFSTMPDAQITILPGNTGNPVWAWVYDLKVKLLDNVYRVFVDPEASLLAGILLGVDSGLPAPLQQAFKDTGTAHIIAISGFNIAIIAAIFIFIFGRLFGPRLGPALAVLGILFYTFLVGAEPAVVRAALMGMLSLLAVQFGRRQMGLLTLAVVAAIMAAVNPQVLWDIGFQLSFFATLGLILYGAPLQSAAAGFLARYFPASRAAQYAGYLADFVLLTLAAQVTTIPIMAYHFQQVSLVSFVANPFILPAQPAVMILGGLAVLGSMVLLPLGRLLALAAWPLTAYTIRAVEFFDALPHGVLYLGSFSLGFVVLFYALLFGVTLGGSHLKGLYGSLRQRFRFITITVVLASLFICTLLAWRLAASRPDGRLHVVFISAGSADAVLIQTPAGRNLLINGGPSVSALSDALGRRISLLAPSLDWLILASTDEQQVGALPRVLPRYPPQHVLVAGNPGSSFSSRTVVQWLDAQGIPITQADKGQLLDLGGGALLRVIDVSTRGATILVTWNEFHLLLPIGANLDTLDALKQGAAVGPVEVISLAQSGYAPLTPPDWIVNLNPRLVVISVAGGDDRGRPDKETLEALAGRSVLRTDINGWIDVSTDGNQMWVDVQRQPEGDGLGPEN
ncbi:MAG: ComEC/Rec2 family competence protein, partial [Anaerolineae bacterium]